MPYWWDGVFILNQPCTLRHGNKNTITETLYFMLFNTLRPIQNGHRFADDVFKCVFLNGNVWILLKISLKFVLKFPINNIPALVQIMAWRRSGDKPLSEPMMVSLLTHICVTRPQWVTVYPKKYAHGFCIAVLCCGYTLTDFPISIRLTSLALWQSNDCPVPAKQPWWIWINTSCEFIMNDCITTTKQSTTKPCAFSWDIL